MKLSWMAFILMLVWQPAMASELYRWVDSNGKVHYGDVVPNDVQQVEEKKLTSSTTSVSGDEALSFEMRRAKQRFPVTLYVTENCIEPCQQARDFLSQRHIPFTEKQLQTQAEFDEFKQQSGSDAVPSLQVGQSWLKGYLATTWQDQLDAAGYPK